MSFLYPKILWFLIAIPLCVAFYWIVARRRYATLTLPTLYRLKGGGVRVFLRHLPFTLEMVALAFMIVALARPRDTESYNVNKLEGIDIMLVLDASGSMMARDLKPNRFEAAKEVAKHFIAQRPNDNIGLVVFAGESFTRCPLTTDHVTLLQRLESVELGYLEDGTAIGMGLVSACNRLEESKTKSKIVVLLTDGTNNAGSITPSTAAAMAESLGIRIYTIAVGTYGEAPFPIQTAFGVVEENVKVEIDEASLKSIAKETGAAYYRATDNKSLEAIYDEIDKLEKSKLITHQRQAYRELFAPWVGIAFLLLLLSLILRSTYCRTNP
ncbi:von Willebrand factor type A domain protein [Bacteroidales bacterium KA00251]|nr:von Willebrand factor type A domain protein [Bacteroidales bacterium KA00251]